MTHAIFTTYYTGKPNPQTTAKEAVSNDFSMIEGWYNSVVRLGLHGVIFHDHLTKEFVEEYECPNVHFVHVDYISERGLNDERYYVYLRELIQKKGIEWVVTTDLFDVDFLKDPFEYITNKNVIYVGSETPESAHVINGEFWPVIKNKARRAYGEVPSWWTMAVKYLLNAGLVGGHRDIMIRLLNLMIEDFDKINTTLNTNMFVLAKTIFVNKIPFVTGYPLHSSYKKFEKTGGFYIRHK